MSIRKWRLVRVTLAWAAQAVPVELAAVAAREELVGARMVAQAETPAALAPGAVATRGRLAVRWDREEASRPAAAAPRAVRQAAAGRGRQLRPAPVAALAVVRVAQLRLVARSRPVAHPVEAQLAAAQPAKVARRVARLAVALRRAAVPDPADVAVFWARPSRNTLLTRFSSSFWALESAPSFVVAAGGLGRVGTIVLFRMSCFRGQWELLV